MRILASPVITIPAEPRAAALKALKDVVVEHEIVKVIVGDPKKLDGTSSATTKQVAEWTAWFRGEIGLPVESWDERLTTSASQRLLAERKLKPSARKGVVDQLAAVLILQGYVDAQRIRSRP